MALAGNTVAAGAPYDTINGNKDQGSVSLFDLTSRSRPLPKLLANEGTANERFGYAVALRGDTLAVGAPSYVSNGVSAVCVFRLENSRWVQRQKLTADNGATKYLFGQAVALSDELLAVGTLGGRPGGQNRVNRRLFHAAGLADLGIGLSEPGKGERVRGLGAARCAPRFRADGPALRRGRLQPDAERRPRVHRHCRRRADAEGRRHWRLSRGRPGSVRRRRRARGDADLVRGALPWLTTRRTVHPAALR